MTSISPLLSNVDPTLNLPLPTEIAPTDLGFADLLEQGLDSAAEVVDEPLQALQTAEAEDEATKESTYSEAMQDALMESMKETALLGMGGSDNSAVSATSSAASMLLSSAAENGEIGDQELAMFMLMMMMQEFQGSDIAPLMNAMAALMSDGQGSLQFYTPTGVSAKYGVKYNFGQYGKSANSIGTDFLPSQAWLPTTFLVTSSEGKRSVNLLRRVIDQFNVETAERYEAYRYGGDTYCNIFVWDVTRALGCEIPHYVDRQTSEPRSYPDISGAYELDANGTADWLAKHGAKYGWIEVTAEEAQAWANNGNPAVTAWKNATGGAGHVQIVSPSKDGKYDSGNGVAVAQAGSKNTSYDYLAYTFSKDKRPNVRYYIHA